MFIKLLEWLFPVRLVQAEEVYYRVRNLRRIQ